FAERFLIVVVPFLFPLLPYPPADYVPTIEEIAATLGIYALGALAFVILAKVIPLLELDDHK
ncbi:MAG TPA: dehydrogenase, partial [Dehalococcoidia bacterium]|nr:dehydrogenase [Dehalococcoidia bacterium]